MTVKYLCFIQALSNLKYGPVIILNYIQTSFKMPPKRVVAKKGVSSPYINLTWLFPLVEEEATSC